MESILSRLTPLFRDVLDDATLVITPESSAETMPSYDSLAHIDIISAIEKEFGIQFDFVELVALRSVGDMIALVSRKTSVAA
jgi:acyl carrier protein